MQLTENRPLLGPNDIATVHTAYCHKFPQWKASWFLGTRARAEKVNYYKVKDSEVKNTCCAPNELSTIIQLPDHHSSVYCIGVFSRTSLSTCRQEIDRSSTLPHEAPISIPYRTIQHTITSFWKIIFMCFSWPIWSQHGVGSASFLLRANTILHNKSKYKHNADCHSPILCQWTCHEIQSSWLFMTED